MNCVHSCREKSVIFSVTNLNQREQYTWFWSENKSLSLEKKAVLFQAFLNKKKKASIHYLYLSIATSIKLTAAHHQQESSQLFLIGNEKEANYNFVDREKTNTTENMKETVYHSTFIASWTKLNAT